MKLLPCQQKVEKIQKHMQKNKVSIYSIYTAVSDNISGEDVKIELEESGVPFYISLQWLVLIPVLEPLKQELDTMETMRVIGKATQAVEWYYSIFPVEKLDNDVRLLMVWQNWMLQQNVKCIS